MSCNNEIRSYSSDDDDSVTYPGAERVRGRHEETSTRFSDQFTVDVPTLVEAEVAPDFEDIIAKMLREEPELLGRALAKGALNEREDEMREQEAEFTRLLQEQGEKHEKEAEEQRKAHHQEVAALVEAAQEKENELTRLLQYQREKYEKEAEEQRKAHHQEVAASVEAAQEKENELTRSLQYQREKYEKEAEKQRKVYEEEYAGLWECAEDTERLLKEQKEKYEDEAATQRKMHEQVVADMMEALRENELLKEQIKGALCSRGGKTPSENRSGLKAKPDNQYYDKERARQHHTDLQNFEKLPDRYQKGKNDDGQRNEDKKLDNYVFEFFEVEKHQKPSPPVLNNSKLTFSKFDRNIMRSEDVNGIVKEEGTFQCLFCKAPTAYKLKECYARFRTFFIPHGGGTKTHEYVKCVNCQSHFVPLVLGMQRSTTLISVEKTAETELGIRFAFLSSSICVVLELASGSPFSDHGLSPGARILKIQGVDIKTQHDLQLGKALLISAKGKVTVVAESFIFRTVVNTENESFYMRMRNVSNGNCYIDSLGPRNAALRFKGLKEGMHVLNVAGVDVSVPFKPNELTTRFRKQAQEGYVGVTVEFYYVEVGEILSVCKDIE